MKLPGRIREFGYARERAAVALLGLSFFCVLYALMALGPPPELLPWRAAFGALALCYVTAFVSLAAGWFWGRWFVSGLAWSGAMVGLAGLAMVGWQPALGIYGGVHAAVALLVAGPKMSERYEGQTQWRERFGMDEFGAAKVGKYVSRVSAALPSFLLWLLAPRPDSTLVSACLAVLLALGGAGVLMGRTWGLVATCCAAGALVFAGVTAGSSPRILAGWAQLLGYAGSAAGATAAAVLLAAAVVPFVRPAVRYFRSLRK